MNVPITTGQNNYQILDTGSVITFKDEALTFNVAGVKITFRFKQDKVLTEQKLAFSAINNTEMDVILTNFNNTLGSGNAAPLKLAKIDNRNVYLNFIVYALTEDSSKLVHYTWYIREEVQNG